MSTRRHTMYTHRVTTSLTLAVSTALMSLAIVAALAVFDAGRASAQDIDINVADADTIAALPGIGKTTAKAIVKYRTDNGPFAEPNDLLKVKGVGKKTLAKIESRLLFSGTEDAGGGGGGGGDDEGGGGGEDVAAKGGMSLQRGNRMEFDGRLIRGETAGAGAVFLFERAPRPLPSMVKKRTSYLDDTIESVLGPQRAEKEKEVLAEAAAKMKADEEKATEEADEDKKTKKKRRPRRRRPRGKR